MEIKLIKSPLIEERESNMIKKSVLFVTFFVTSIIFAQENGKIAFGPYIQQMSTKSATICWSTLLIKPTLTDQNGNLKIIFLMFD